MTVEIVALSTRLSRIKQWNQAFEAEYQAQVARDPHPELLEIKTPSELLVRECIEGIRYYYQQGNKDEAFFLFLGFIKAYAKHVRLKRTEVWQVEDILISIYSRESVWIRSRRGGKSRDLTLLATFFSIVQLPVIWFAAASDQLQQSQEYFMMNPFIEGIYENEVRIINSPSIDLSVLTSGRTASKGRAVIIFDEGGKVQQGLKIYEYYTYSRAIIADSFAFGGDVHVISASTPALLTAIQTDYDAVRLINPDAVSVHPYTDCWWISESWVKQEEMTNDTDYVDQEYRCIFTCRQGIVYSNIQLESKETILKYLADSAGIDINLKEALVFVGITRDEQLVNHIWLLGEKEVNWVENNTCYDELQPSNRIQIRTFIFHTSHTFFTECENGGYNEKEAHWILNHIPNVSLQTWEEEKKQERMRFAQHSIIHCCPELTPNTYRDLKTCIKHPLKGIYLKDAQHPNHWHEAFLHALRNNNNQFITDLPSLVMEKTMSSQYIKQLIKHTKYHL